VKYPGILAKSIADFYKDGGIMLAASLSYFFMMALVPLCLFVIAIFGYVLGKYPEFYAFFSDRLISFFPDITEGIAKELGNLITFEGIGSFSIVLYGLLSFEVFSSMESALNTVFEVKKRRGILRSIVLALIVVTIVIMVILVSFAATLLIPLLKTFRPTFPDVSIGFITIFLIRYAVPFLMVLCTITVMYVFLPKIKVKVSYAFAGALFAAVFLESAKHVFTLYVGTVIKFGTIYGPLTAFVVFLLWLFYSSCIFLIGAEIVHNLILCQKQR
jgi:membrane protein